jgi:AcrR family transcriptional regulator
VLTHILPDDVNEHSLRLRDRDETRRRLVDAAERVLRAKGLARATTKEIAREAGLAEGTLYLHFADKLDLIRAVQEKLLPPFIELLLQLPARAGTRTVEANLTEVAEQALVLYRDLLLVGSGLFADPELLERFRVRMRELGGGPHKAYGPIVAYLEAERALGRVDAGADLVAVGVLLLGACQQLVFIEQLSGPEVTPLRDRPSPAAALVRALLAGLGPAHPPHPKDMDLEARA